MSEELFKKMAQSVMDGEPEEAEALARLVVEQGIDPLEAINQGFVQGVNFVGEQFSCGEMFLPELVMAGEAMKAAVAILEPELARRGAERKMLGKVVIGTVEGDIHEIGKTLVATMLSASGFKVFDLGVDVPISKFIEVAQAENADIIGMSALLTTTMVKQKTLIEKLVEIGMRERVKVMVGGAPVTQEWATSIGTDGFSPDAIGSVMVAKQLMGLT